MIAADIAGAHEQLVEAVLFVRREGPEHFTGAIERLTGDDFWRQRVAQAGLGRARHFAASDLVRGILAALDRFEAVCRAWVAG